MRISLRYVTRFVYPNPVWESHNALRACPADTAEQTLVSYSLAVDPEATIFRHADRWGTQVDTFGIVAPHDELVVEARATIDTSSRSMPAESSLDAIHDQAYRNAAWEFLQPTRHTRWGHGLARVAQERVDASTGFVEAVLSIESLVHETMDYRPGSTVIGVDVEDVWVRREGVCQDFAHLGIALLRTIGVATRYVSGYFYAADPTNADDSDEEEIIVATHAWVEVAVPGGGWWALDPTNAASVGERHVKIGHGRDYDDVTPLRGVYYGETGHVASAEVTMSTGKIIRHELPVADPIALQELQQQ